MKVVIFAGGFGTRLSEETAVRPKPMVEVGGRPLIDHALDLTAPLMPLRRVVNLHHKGEVLRDHLAGRDVILSDSFRTDSDYAALTHADLIVEAVFEAMEVKEQVFRALDGVAKPGAVLATNTSYLDVNRIADATGRPADVIGLHFFSPAHVMRLLEVVVADRTAPEVVATGFALARRLKKIVFVFESS